MPDSNKPVPITRPVILAMLRAADETSNEEARSIILGALQSEIISRGVANG